MAEKSQNLESKDSKDLELAKANFKLVEEAEFRIRQLALEDQEFAAGSQWPQDILQQRTLDSRPCLTINKIPGSIRQITNDQRQNRPSSKIYPVDDNADVETAKVIQGLVRHIEYDSNADVAYDTAFENAVTGGFGYWRLITQYSSPLSFEQDIKIKRIRNPFNVYLDPHSKEPDGSDASWGFIFDDISKEDFKREFPNAELSKMPDWKSIGDSNRDWINEKSCRVGEYYYKEYKDDKIVRAPDGLVYKLSELPPEIKELAELEKWPMRDTQVCQIKWFKFNGIEILERADIPGEWIPIIPVIGDERIIDGERILEGVVRHAKDPQRMYNYWASTETEAIALSPRTPYLVADGQIPPEYEQQWKEANTKNHAYLPYTPVITDNGLVVPPPQRSAIDTPTQSITNARMLAADDLKSTTGIYDAALGARSNETSGKAIQNRAHQAQTSNFHYIDNLTRAIRHSSRIIVSWIPVVYDSARAIRILGDNDEQEVVRIHEMFNHNGKDVHYDFIGKYDVVVETGPTFATKRQEAVAAMLDVSSAYPQIWQFAGDIMAKNMDWPGASDLAERFKKMLPPGIAEDKKKQPIPPEAQAMLQQLDQQNQALTQQLNEFTEQIKTKQIEIESKERIETMKIEKDYALKMAELQGQAAILTLKAELDDIKKRQELLNMDVPIDQEFNGSGPDQAVIQDEQQPTDGASSGLPMGV